jgi:hypothetical protein
MKVKMEFDLLAEEVAAIRNHQGDRETKDILDGMIAWTFMRHAIRDAVKDAMVKHKAALQDQAGE